MGQIRRLVPCVCVALMLTPNLCHPNETIVPDAVRQKAYDEGTVRVIVQLRVSALPEGELSSVEAVASQRRAIASAQSAVLTELAGTSHRVIRTFERSRSSRLTSRRARCRRWRGRPWWWAWRRIGWIRRSAHRIAPRRTMIVRLLTRNRASAGNGVAVNRLLSLIRRVVMRRQK